MRIYCRKYRKSYVNVHAYTRRSLITIFLFLFFRARHKRRGGCTFPMRVIEFTAVTDQKTKTELEYKTYRDQALCSRLIIIILIFNEKRGRKRSGTRCNFTRIERKRNEIKLSRPLILLSEIFPLFANLLRA